MARTLDIPTSPELDRYREQIAQHGLAPLWERIANLVTPEPRPSAVPFLWDYDRTRDLLLHSADLITAKQAERRVLILDNPGLAGQSAIVETLYAGWQVVMPGEIAPAHRHTPAALRFILEGDGGGYTAINGEKAHMKPGDVVLTPPMRWHDHGNDGEVPVVWLDVLDLPFIGRLGPVFSDLLDADRYPDQPAEGTTNSIYGSGLRPVFRGDDEDASSPLFHYPYEQMRASLLATSAQMDPHPALGCRMEYVNPMSGGPAMPTISMFLQHRMVGDAQAYQTTENQVYCCVEGSGKVEIEHLGQPYTIEFKPRDTFAVPCWARQQWHTNEDTVLFCASDRGIQQATALLREDFALDD